MYKLSHNERLNRWFISHSCCPLTGKLRAQTCGPFNSELEASTWAQEGLDAMKAGTFKYNGAFLPAVIPHY